MPPARRGTEFQVTLDQAAVNRVDRMLGTYQGADLGKRIDAALTAELRPLVSQLKSAERSSGIQNRTGAHLRSISRRKNRKRPGEIAAQTVGPQDRKRHLLIQGHRIVTPGGRDTGGRSRDFPYVGEVVNQASPGIMGRLGRALWQLR